MAQSFDFELDLQDHTISPETATPSSQQSPQKSKRRWSASTDGSKFDCDSPAHLWEAPPVPPIPPDQPSEAWRRRSLMRDSYTSQMSLRVSESGTRPQTPADTVEAIATCEKGVSANGGGARTKRKSRMAMNVQEKGQYDELHWQVSGLNPKGWSRRRKWMHTIAAGGVAFTVLFSSSIVAPASATIATSFSASPVVAVLSTSLYVLGLAFGAMLGTASSALVGRKVAQSGSLLLSVAFTIASACVSSFNALHACRFFAGLFASPALWVSTAVPLEMWTVEKLATPLTAFGALALAGLVLGPIAGSYIIESQNVRWTQYTIIIACAVPLALVLAMRETHKNTVQRRRGDAQYSRPSLQSITESAILKPLSSLLRSPATLLLSTNAGAVLGIFYTAFTAFPSVYASAYDLTLSQQGLTFISMLVGLVLGAILLNLSNIFLYCPRIVKAKQHYDAEVERAIAEEKQTRRRSRRNSKASSKVAKRKSTASLFSTQQNGSRLSLLQALTKHDSRSDLVLTTIDFEDKNVALSIAAAEYLNSVNEKRILPERVLLILSKQPPFNETCEQLESFGLRVDRVKLAQVFLDALQQQSETNPAAAAPTIEAGHGKAVQHANTAAALEGGPQPSKPGLKSSPSTWTLLSNTSPTFKAPPHWRLWPALPASVLAVGALCLFAWTARSNIHWAAPIVGMGLFAASAAIVLPATTLFVLEKCGEDVVAGGILLLWLLAAIFPIFAVPLFQTLTVGWACSVLALIQLVCCIPVWLTALKGGK